MGQIVLPIGRDGEEMQEILVHRAAHWVEDEAGNGDEDKHAHVDKKNPRQGVPITKLLLDVLPNRSEHRLCCWLFAIGGWPMAKIGYLGVLIQTLAPFAPKQDEQHAEKRPADVGEVGYAGVESANAEENLDGPVG